MNHLRSDGGAQDKTLHQTIDKDSFYIVKKTYKL